MAILAISTRAVACSAAGEFCSRALPALRIVSLVFSRTATREGRLAAQSVVDQAIAGLDRLNSDEYTSFDTLNHAYREKFGFPLVIAVRENTKETILKSGNARLQNSPAAEQAAALVEIAKIANLRLLDLVEEPVDQPVA